MKGIYRNQREIKKEGKMYKKMRSNGQSKRKVKEGKRRKGENKRKVT